jgi:hypothetical protein
VSRCVKAVVHLLQPSSPVSAGLEPHPFKPWERLKRLFAPCRGASDLQPNAGTGARHRPVIVAVEIPRNFVGPRDIRVTASSGSTLPVPVQRIAVERRLRPSVRSRFRDRF